MGGKKKVLTDPRVVRDGVEQANTTAFGTAFAWFSCQRDLPPSQGQCVPALWGHAGPRSFCRAQQGNHTHVLGGLLHLFLVVWFRF